MKQVKKNFAVAYIWRNYFVLSVFFVAVIMLLLRAYELQVLNSDFLNSQGTARQQRVVTVPAHRGTITDRHGEPLALSTPVDSIWVVPEEFTRDSKSINTLAEKLGMQATTIWNKLAGNEGREFLYIKRQIPPSLAAEVKQLKLPGVYRQREYRRYYPSAEVTAHVLGFTDIDDRGQEGLELAYNEWLTGHAGAKKVVRDRLGQVIENVGNLEIARPGRDLTLSVDKRLQYLAYRELKAAVHQHRAESGSLVMLDSYSGEVLAMVNQPSFNPHKRDELLGQRYRNRAITDLIEPGSTMKPFTAAAALENGHITALSNINTNPGVIKIAGHAIRDSKNYGVLSVEGVFRHSSNVGATKLAIQMPASELWHSYNRFGFGRATGSGFPGESSGFLKHFDRWSRLEHATMGFGYGLSATTLQLARAYCVIANGGFEHPATFIRQDEPPASQRVITAESAAILRKLLSSVVNEGGTGRRARVAGYRIAGKTGTVRISTAAGYSDDEHTSVFAGMAPLSDPRLVIVVVINKPRGEQYYGGQVAAPVFASVMADALRLLNIAPDDPKSLFAKRPLKNRTST